MKKCKNCGFESNDDLSEFCIKCGNDLKENQKKKSGFFNRLKNNIEERKEERIIEEKRKKESDSKYICKRFFNGVKCEVVFPGKELILKTHSGGTRALATLGFGLVGLAATSNVKQEKRNKSVNTIFQIVEKGIVFKNADDGKDLRISYDNIINASFEVKYYNYVYINLLENQQLKIIIENAELSRRKESIKHALHHHIIPYINEHANGLEYEEAGWGLPSKKEDMEESVENRNADSDFEKLEKLMDMYKEGLLTEDEFKAMKNKIING